jgi:hypothetical protein
MPNTGALWTNPPIVQEAANPSDHDPGKID